MSSLWERPTPDSDPKPGTAPLRKGWSTLRSGRSRLNRRSFVLSKRGQSTILDKLYPASNRDQLSFEIFFEMSNLSLKFAPLRILRCLAIQPRAESRFRG